MARRRGSARLSLLVRCGTRARGSASLVAEDAGPSPWPPLKARRGDIDARGLRRSRSRPPASADHADWCRRARDVGLTGDRAVRSVGQEPRRRRASAAASLVLARAARLRRSRWRSAACTSPSPSRRRCSATSRRERSAARPKMRMCRSLMPVAVYVAKTGPPAAPRRPPAAVRATVRRTRIAGTPARRAPNEQIQGPGHIRDRRRGTPSRRS